MISIKNMFGIDPPTKAEPIEDAELKGFLVDLLRNVYAAQTLGYYDNPFKSNDITRAMTFLARRDDLYERRLELVRHLLDRPGDLLNSCMEAHEPLKPEPHEPYEPYEPYEPDEPDEPDPLRFAKNQLVNDTDVRALLRDIAARLESLLGEPASIQPRGPFR